MEEQKQQRIFNIEKIYVKDLSLEISDAPLVFMEPEAPKIDMQMHIDDKNVKESMYEVVLTVTITAKTKDKTLFLIEVQQAGVFQIINIAEEEMLPILNIVCPNAVSYTHLTLPTIYSV